MEWKLADLLLDPAAAPDKVAHHVEPATRCRGELEELRATMTLLDRGRRRSPAPTS